MIPNEYTACEKYLGYTIALKDSRYHAFNDEGERIAALSGNSRAEVRHWIREKR